MASHRISAVSFAHLFTVAIGVPPHRYVSRMRLQNAMAEIVAGRLPLAQRALNAHFPSQASFTRAFRRDWYDASRASTAPAQHPRTHFVGRARARGSNQSELSQDQIASAVMSILQSRRQRDASYPTKLLKSSNDLGWSTLLAELHSYSSCSYEGPGFVAPHARIIIPVRGSDQGLCRVQTRRKLAVWAVDNRLDLVAADRRQVRRDPYRLTGELEAINIYVPTVVFARLMDDYNLPAAVDRSIRYSRGVQDEVINQIGRVSAGGDDVSDGRGAHARGNVVAATCCTAGAYAFRD